MSESLNSAREYSCEITCDVGVDCNDDVSYRLLTVDSNGNAFSPYSTMPTSSPPTSSSSSTVSSTPESSSSKKNKKKEKDKKKK